MARTRVVLSADVEALGKVGDVVTVSSGYARNYLVPRGLAVAATKAAERQAETLRQGAAQRESKERSAHEATKQRLESGPLLLRSQAGPDGRLFGSVTGAQVAQAIEDVLGITVDRHQVHLPEPIRHLGYHEVHVRLLRDVTAKVMVEVIEG